MDPLAPKLVKYEITLSVFFSEFWFYNIGFHHTIIFPTSAAKNFMAEVQEPE
jgi:hypothetical protein